MMKSPLVKFVFLISYWIVTIVALNLGLIPLLSYNPLQMVLGKIGMDALFMPIHYVVGIAGVISLIGLLGMKDCQCKE
jgi:uncharacterized membrane protein YuzA (DUF378 family)